jgi:hypothetical protein
LARLLILFVHGLGGGKGTWDSFEQLLKADADLKDRIAVAEYNFPTRLLRWLPTWRSTPLQDLARGLATEIRTRYAEHQKIFGLQEIEWVFLATSERWKHACEHLEPQIFLVA